MRLKCRDRKERRVFQQLLQTIPRLQERLMESEQADLLHIAELVCFILLIILNHALILQRFRKVFPVHDPTIPRV
jgi:uncharacterized membrane protein